jgi:hypothetical protein
VYRLMNITVKIYDVRRQFGGITEPGAKSMLLSHAHKCNTSLDTMLVSVAAGTYVAHPDAFSVLVLRCNRFTECCTKCTQNDISTVLLPLTGKL